MYAISLSKLLFLVDLRYDTIQYDTREFNVDCKWRCRQQGHRPNVLCFVTYYV